MTPTRLPLYWRVFAVNASLLTAVALLLIVSPVTISFPIALTEAIVVLIALVVTIAVNAVLLRRAFAPLARMAQRMEMVDLLRPGQRLQVLRHDEVGRVVAAFNRMLDRLERERQESGRRVLAAQEAERIGIARDLHDEVGQVLTGVLLRVDDAETKVAVRQALEEVRRIAQELRPELLEHLGLVSALTELSRKFADSSGLRVERRFAHDLPQLSDEAELAVYRVAQESLTNVARHAEARNVLVALGRGKGSLVLSVSDDGRGMSQEVAANGHGGLRGMRERALLVGGALAVKRSRAGGVEVRLEVPAEVN
jgi:two-component system, NarL family, sensor histidine kinase UhpB